MLKSFTIENYKSIERMTLDLGRVNVLIGENGAGKSNILEAMALAGAAQAGKLDNEFLASRGIRAVVPSLMTSAFSSQAPSSIGLGTAAANGVKTHYTLTHDNKPYASWRSDIDNDSSSLKRPVEELHSILDKHLETVAPDQQLSVLTLLLESFENAIRSSDRTRSLTSSSDNSPELTRFLKAAFPVAAGEIANFVTFSPENSALRSFEHEGQIAPLGVRGEGLLKLLTVLEQSEDRGPIKQIKGALSMLGWFEGYTIVDGTLPRMDIIDRFLADGTVFDQRSANEGFLYIAFYFALFCTDLTPKLFAVDNIDASLNPKLCSAMVAQLVAMANHNDKQVILTTHNPSVLDGLDLNDDEQRLFVIRRDRHGRTRADRVEKPRYEGKPRKLSELFMAGLIGGLPKGF